MPSKNDLSSLRVESKNTLQNAQHSFETKKAWRKPKPVQEKQSEMIGLRFTLKEYENVKAKAGLVPIATYLKHALFKQTDIFN